MLSSADRSDVRFKNQGLGVIEVQDNGAGVSPQNYETLALKHHTSKLSTYSDLTTLQTFGFRGEALSSLCAVSRFSVITCMAEDIPKGSKLEFETSGTLKCTSVVAAQRGTTVTVENLFSNLPVRRQELERNIKREWNRVVSVLGQYACIQTGIKFTVSQQAGKGKKTTLFSTKGNQTTRENIVNVFGAKTLTALVTLDLKLALEPTSGPSQRWSAQEDGGTKDIRIVGQISRPASGEGRQLPDRQMFFVNSRPCGLPQVTKAFNEVYKSYNGTQSPFIFANIILDTHLYDVNVSPDKRTILLHDQSRMLENLKASLTVLFESQDYTVPISQLPTQKQPLYKQLTISRENTKASETSQPDDPRSDRDESEVTGDGDESQSSIPEKPKPKVGPVSRESMNRDKNALSLISDWVGRKAVERTITKAPTSKTVSGASDLLKKWKGNDTQEPTETQITSSHEPASQMTSTMDTQAQAHEIIMPAVDLDNRLVGLEPSTTDPGATVMEPELPVPCVSQSPMSSHDVKTFVGSTSRSPPSAATVATITVGDHTITSTIRSPSFKRARTEETPCKARNVKRTMPGSILPSFGQKLSQRFSAPGTQQPVSVEENIAEEDQIEHEAMVVEELDAASSSHVDSEQVSRQGSPEAPSAEDSASERQIASSLSENGVRHDDEDEEQKKVREEARVQEMIENAEQTAAVASQDNADRTKALLRGGTRKKDTTIDLVGMLTTSVDRISQQFQAIDTVLNKQRGGEVAKVEDAGIEVANAEEVLSLTISKEDFAQMRIVGQFNLGFILATRSSSTNPEDQLTTHADDLFIIDQHASDEKYNFEQLQASTIVQSQRLVHPKTLELTAMEEEIVIDNLKALETNGFIVKVDQSGESTVGERCQLVSLPLSRETTFSTKDLEELLGHLVEHTGGSVPRPSKVRKMIAMRACRSSIMIGKTLTQTQMEKVVKHMGEIDKPWNCPHGRPTMRHLCGIGVWDELGWGEGDSRDGVKCTRIDWGAYVRGNIED